MAFNFPLFSLAFFVGGALALFFASVYWKHYPAPGALLFTLFLLFCGVWTLASGLESGAAITSTKFFWSKVEYIGAAFSGVLWLSFALDYTGSQWWRRFPYVVLLWLFPFATVILAWTNDLHHLVWTGSHPTFVGSYFILIYEHGPWFWIMVICMYLLFIYGMVVLWRFIYHKPNIFRWQIAMLTIGTLIPLAGSVIYLLDLSPIQGLDFAPFTFIFASLIYAVAIFRFRFLDVVPLARGILVESLPDGILVLNADGCIADMNPSAERMMGVTIESASGKHLDKVWPKLDLNRSNVDIGRHTELVTEISGSQNYLDISVTPLQDGHGSVAGQLIVLRDITERKLTQRKLETLYSEERRLSNSLQEEIDKRSKYTRALVHELRTPLTSILASSELLESEINDSILSALVKNIRRASLNLEQRINELIELARGEIGMLKINPMPLDISELILEIVSEMTPVASGKGLAIVSEIAELPPVQGDRSRLRQVMTNLLSNAIKFTNKGTITIRASKYDSDVVLVQVQDTGHGIDKEQMEDLFDPYRRKTNTGREMGGLGIGLALSKIFIDLHKGRIWAESTPGSGSIFSFTIPIVADSKGNLLN